MPANRAFVDSNIVLYAILEDDRRKMMIARRVLGDVLPEDLQPNQRIESLRIENPFA